MLQRLWKIVLEIVRPKSYAGLLGCITFLAAGYALIGDPEIANIFTTIFGLLALMIASRATSPNPKVFRFNVIFAIVIIALFVVAIYLKLPLIHSNFARITAIACMLIFIANVTIMMLKDIFSSPVTVNKICGAVCVYLLIGAIFEQLHTLTYCLDHNSYTFAYGADRKQADLQLDVRAVFMYYSFTTLTTLGYGDITPLSRAARMLSWMEAVVGQFYLSILVARLVGLYIADEIAKQITSENDLEI
ncbi:MAG TPA: potassium channel family protein [Chroococcales cyanobacterium]